MNDEGWVTGPAVDLIFQLKALQMGDQLRYSAGTEEHNVAKDCVGMEIVLVGPIEWDGRYGAWANAEVLGGCASDRMPPGALFTPRLIRERFSAWRRPTKETK